MYKNYLYFCVTSMCSVQYADMYMYICISLLWFMTNACTDSVHAVIIMHDAIEEYCKQIKL